MKRFITTLTFLVATLTTLNAQEIANDSTIIFGKNGQNRMTIVNNETVKFKIAGKEFQISADSEATTKKKEIKYATIPSLGAIELGINTMVNTDYSMYNTPNEATMMQFGNRKSTYVAMNIFTENLRLTKTGSFSIDMGVGIAWENYVFAGNYSMRYTEGMMRPIQLDGGIKKSKLMARYLHMPVLLNYSHKNKFFIAAGVNLDVLIGTHLKHKNPKVVYKSETVTLSPIQVSGTIRLGTDDLYGFINYSPMEMFKAGTGPCGERLSAGIGFNF